VKGQLVLLLEFLY